MTAGVGAYEQVGEVVGQTVGAYAGGAAGAAAGSVFGPVGAVAGRYVGAKVGAYGGGIAGAWLGSKMDEANDQAEPKKQEDTKKEEEATKPECEGRCKEEEEKRKKEEAEKRAKNIHDHPEQFEGQDKKDVEQQLDKDLRDNAGWNKSPLKNGSGSRYTSPNGNQQIRINDGYPGGSNRGPSDPIHSGPYLNVPSTGTRVPLKGNPTLYTN